jgi:hypothetical protein
MDGVSPEKERRRGFFGGGVREGASEKDLTRRWALYLPMGWGSWDNRSLGTTEVLATMSPGIWPFQTPGYARVNTSYEVF